MSAIAAVAVQWSHIGAADMTEQVPSKECDALVALKYDTCECTDKCEPCRGVRQLAIAEIERLQSREREAFRLANAATYLVPPKYALHAELKAFMDGQISKPEDCSAGEPPAVLNRYSIELEGDICGAVMQHNLCSDGEWVRYEDVTPYLSPVHLGKECICPCRGKWADERTRLMTAAACRCHCHVSEFRELVERAGPPPSASLVAAAQKIASYNACNDRLPDGRKLSYVLHDDIEDVRVALTKCGDPT